MRLLFLIIVIAMGVALDQLTKSLFADMQPGSILAGPFLGLVDIRLVHNTGGAWGIFSDSTFGARRVLACRLHRLRVFLCDDQATSRVQTVAFALIVAGGIGNAIDRFLQGYVVDFIEFSFFDFPVFNVADIGVTCGFALLVISMLVMMRADGSEGDR